MRHPHYRNARERHSDAYDLDHAREAILANYRRGIIAQHTAARQLRSAGLYEAEIREELTL